MVLAAPLRSPTRRTVTSMRLACWNHAVSIENLRRYNRLLCPLPKRDASWNNSEPSSTCSSRLADSLGELWPVAESVDSWPSFVLPILLQQSNVSISVLLGAVMYYLRQWCSFDSLSFYITKHSYVTRMLRSLIVRTTAVRLTKFCKRLARSASRYIRGKIRPLTPICTFRWAAKTNASFKRENTKGKKQPRISLLGLFRSRDADTKNVTS